MRMILEPTPDILLARDFGVCSGRFSAATDGAEGRTGDRQTQFLRTSAQVFLEEVSVRFRGRSSVDHRPQGGRPHPNRRGP